MSNLICIFLLIASLNINYDFLLLNSIKIKSQTITTDNLENVYVSNNNQLLKFNNKGVLQCNYSNVSRGPISFVDATDPFRVLVYYSNFNQLIFLDNMLAEIGSPIKLDDLGIEQTAIACASTQGGFWIYDKQNCILISYNKNLQVVNKGSKLNVLIGENTNPNCLIAKNNQIYMNIPEIGILVFDQFGTYLKTIPIKLLASFQIQNDELMYCKLDSQLLVFKLNKLDLKTNAEKNIILPDREGILDAKLEQDKLYIKKEQNIDIYEIK